MENAADALKMAFAVLVFIIAISILFFIVSKTKTTADVVLYYSDTSNFQEKAPYSDKNRTVKVQDVIATLYRYYTESISVTIKIDENVYCFDSESKNEPLEDGETRTTISTQEGKERNLGKFVTNKLLTLEKDAMFDEQFTEAPISGIYSTGPDGSEITLSAGGKKVYVTYTYPSINQ